MCVTLRCTMISLFKRLLKEMAFVTLLIVRKYTLDSYIKVVFHALFHFCIDGLFPNGSLSVRNAERVSSPKGELKKILGYAYRPDPSVQGKLVVDLQGVPFKGSC